MTKESLAKQVKEVIVDQLGIHEEVVESASYVNDLGADSLDCVELAMAFEEEFGIAIPEEDAEKLDTVGKTIEYLCGKLGVKTE